MVRMATSYSIQTISFFFFSFYFCLVSINSKHVYLCIWINCCSDFSLPSFDHILLRRQHTCCTSSLLFSFCRLSSTDTECLCNQQSSAHTIWTDIFRIIINCKREKNLHNFFFLSFSARNFKLFWLQSPSAVSWIILLCKNKRTAVTDKFSHHLYVYIYDE